MPPMLLAMASPHKHLYASTYTLPPGSPRLGIRIALADVPRRRRSGRDYSGIASEGASEGGAIDMVNRGIWYVAGIALIALAGCATHPPTGGVARSTESDVRPSALPTDLVGTWKGSFVPVAADSGGGNAVGDVTLVINHHGTYTLIGQRKPSRRRYSGAGVGSGPMGA